MADEPLAAARERIAALLGEKGPRTGSEIAKAVVLDSFLVWKACKTSPELDVRAPGSRYMRLDRRIEGFARLSPSILREFLTYSVVGLAAEPGPTEARCREVIGRIRAISECKLGVARRMVSDVMEDFGKEAAGDVCFVIAGDIVYGMAHDVPRPERSTGKLVKGSDIDLVAVVDDGFPEASMKRLDELIYAKKRRMLIDPGINEEVDYVIKRLSKVREQARFDDFRKMVAMKILQEGELLSGSAEIFGAIRGILKEHGLVEKLEELERRAEIFRRDGEAALLEGDLDREAVRKTHLFYSAEEFEEFE